MRDLTEAHHTFGRAMLADLTRPDGTTAPPASPVDGNSGGPAVQVHAGAGDGRVRAPQKPDPIRAETLFEPANQPAFETLLRLPRETHALIWDAALAIVLAAPPMPLESPDPWCEDEAAYGRRLDAAHPQNIHSFLSPYGLDLVGRGYGLPRARLVRVQDRDA